MSDGNGNVGDTEDIISRLSDDILIHILSLLPGKTTISTSVLSRRWYPLWVTVPSLELSVSDFLPRGNDLYSQMRRKANFLAFVERFLRRNWPCNIKTLDLKFVKGKFPAEISSIKLDWSKVGPHDYANYFPEELFRHPQSDLDLWTLLAERFKTQNLFISWYTNILLSHQFLPNFFSFRSLVELKLLGSMVVNIPKGSLFPNLRFLELEEIIIKGDYSVSNLINSSCPVLEELLVSSNGDENDFRYLVITAKTLRHLQLEYVNYDGITGTVSGKRIDFSALRYLSLQNVLITDIHSAGVLRALEEANLSISSEDDIGLFWLLKMISNVKKLTLSESTLESLECCTIPNFYYLTSLEILELDCDISSCETLVNILRESPKLQDLHFEGLLFDSSSVRDWTPDYDIPRCLTTCLKTIEINPIKGKKKELRIISYFLKHSQVLQKMIILIEKNGREIRKIKNEILALPKGSPDCDIIFK